MSTTSIIAITLVQDGPATSTEGVEEILVETLTALGFSVPAVTISEVEAPAEPLRSRLGRGIRGAGQTVRNTAHVVVEAATPEPKIGRMTAEELAETLRSQGFVVQAPAVPVPSA